MHVVIFSGGTVRQGRFTAAALAQADLVLAADSGGKTALEFGVSPVAVVGDFDSLDPVSKVTLEQAGCQFITHGSDKDQTDTELAVRYSITQGADSITIIGGSEGDRLDHILANILSLIGSSVAIKLVNGSMQAWVVTGPADITIVGEINDLLSLIPLTPEINNVTTSNLKYPLSHETLYQNRGRGVSNVLTQPEAAVTFTSGTLLLVQTAV